MCSLLGDSSGLRQPPPATHFALSSLVFGAPRTARLSPRFTGFASRTAFSGLGLAAGGLGAWFGFAGPGGAQDAVDGGGDGIDRRHAVHALELAQAGVEVDQRRGLRSVGSQAPLEHLRVIV